MAARGDRPAIKLIDRARRENMRILLWTRPPILDDSAYKAKIPCGNIKWNSGTRMKPFCQDPRLSEDFPRAVIRRAAQGGNRTSETMPWPTFFANPGFVVTSGPMALPTEPHTNS